MSILLKKVPEQVKKIILKVQSEVKEAKTLGKYSQESAIYRIIVEYDEMKRVKSKQAS